MHDQFMQTMQEGHEHFMAGQAANMQARETSTSDWVDFALDRQTVLNTNTGQVNKISNQYTPTGPTCKCMGTEHRGEIRFDEAAAFPRRPRATQFRFRHLQEFS